MSLVSTVRGLRHVSLANAWSARAALSAATADRRMLDPDSAGEGPGELSRLSRDACLAELAAHELGRLAYVRREDVPDVVPVNYRLVGDDLLIASGVGPKLQAGERGVAMALQVDEVDLRTHTGWSVVAVGRATRMSATEQAALPDGIAPVPWARGPRRFLLRLRIERVDGRRLT
jgi:hypothetical protein